MDLTVDSMEPRLPYELAGSVSMERWNPDTHYIMDSHCSEVLDSVDPTHSKFFSIADDGFKSTDFDSVIAENGSAMDKAEVYPACDVVLDNFDIFDSDFDENLRILQDDPGFNWNRFHDPYQNYTDEDFWNEYWADE